MARLLVRPPSSFFLGSCCRTLLDVHRRRRRPPPSGPASGGHAAPHDPPPQNQVPIFRAGINFVRVDVIVSDSKGNAVLDLKPEDFEVSEGGTAQKVETFKLISLDGGLMQGPDGPPRQIRTDHRRGNRSLSRRRAVVCDFHRRLSRAARDEHVRARADCPLCRDAARSVRHGRPDAPVAADRHGPHDAESRRDSGGIRQFLGRKYDYTPTNEIEERYAYYPTEVVEGIRNQVSMWAIKALITRMGGLKEGRKALILVSEGYTALLPPQMRDSMAAFPGPGIRRPAIPRRASTARSRTAPTSAPAPCSRTSSAKSMARPIATTWRFMPSIREGWRPTSSAWT